MEQREQQIITNYEELQGWRKPEGEELEYVKGLLIKDLNDHRMNRPWICVGFWIVFMMSVLGTIFSITEMINYGVELTSLFFIIVYGGLALVMGYCLIIFVRDTERKQCVNLLYRGKMEVLDATVKCYTPGGSSLKRAEIVSVSGQTCNLNRTFDTCYVVQNRITEGLLVKVVRENESMPNFWVIPPYVKNEKYCKIGMK